MNDDDFWERRPILRHIRATASARRAGPWGVLGVILAHVLLVIPPKVRLAPMVGGQGSLNLFVALVGPSGAGKGSAEAAAAHSVRLLDREANDAVPVGVPLGSGEGVARTFRPVGHDTAVTAALFHSPEIDTLSTLAGRQGATLGAELRKMFSGEALGFGNAAVHTRCIVEAHTYRACVIAGVQPLRSRPLLDAADGGLPQRFVWMPVSDSDAPDERPATPRPIELPVMDWGPSSAPIEIVLPAEAVVQIDTHRLRVLRGDRDVDPLDGHLLLVRAKVAVALAVLDGHKHVSLDDWELAAVIMLVSRVQREVCRRALSDAARRRNLARVVDEDERAAVSTDRRVVRAREGIKRRIERHGEQSRAELRRSLKLDIREHFDAAMAELIDEGSVFESAALHGGTKYTGTPVHPALESALAGQMSPEHGDTLGTPGTPQLGEKSTGVPEGVPVEAPLAAETQGCTGVPGVPSRPSPADLRQRPRPTGGSRPPRTVWSSSSKSAGLSAQESS